MAQVDENLSMWKNKISFILYSKYYGNPMSPADLILSYLFRFTTI